MRHQRYKNKLGVNTSHRAAMLKNLAAELIDHKKIKATFSRAKAMRSYVEKLVTLSKTDSVANRRLAFKKLGNKDAVKTLFTDIGPKFTDRKGGYTRILKLADGRVGDNAKMSYIAFVD